ncbi:UvrD-helicase domain-containing protein [Flaviramulus sp. BrNp1-15]|uniref:UvrD-helicase domain-containing protein n=1 Tax=Flaviramulus sp. BrNp1-15 TaxID=2916754 RepID=UPI001EE84D0A|nr:UvrD-helicase domain-containing protein [Flaviramulus sp. BrNp1-15]ULC59623.1 UvrD-helicase domain-containing protein [Flaviramulus sp. BrNp1-15]
MQKTQPFTIYNASAGSGKTFTLVKEYLKILFASSSPFLFKNILAITFTNKAVSEMKERIIETLKQFSEPSILEYPNSMFEVICNELEMEPEKLHNKAEKLLNTIIHNYAAFDISTIDGFTHKLIRTFAHDLQLPLNFEVELDQDALLNEAVDSLIAKAGTDKELTNNLVDFAIEKADDDKSWDVAFDFNKIAKLLVNENDIPFIEKLKDKTLDDFKRLKTQLKKEVTTTKTQIIEQAQSILTLIEETGLQFDDFSGSYLPKHFKKLADENFNVNFDTKWQEDIETKTLYPKRVTDEIASIIEQIQPQIALAFNKTKQAIFHLKFLNSFYKNITPLSVLNAINIELKALKLEQNKMLISEFNSIISKEIKNQPTPFIYERIGEKFNHYFIDEFQDTSVMQWENLIPLLNNSLSSETGSAMLVGDAKQAIYRWRGGKAEQFIGLFNEDNPFIVEKHIKNLPTNYRSFKEIIRFNNGFFKFLSNQVFIKKEYASLYETANQEFNLEDSGYVELSFLDIAKEDNRDDIFPDRVLKTVNRCLENKFNLQDICVLVRKKKEGVAVANYLSQNQIPIVSSETLLLSNSPEVTFINDLLALLIQPKNNEMKISVLNYLTTLFNIENKHAFFSNHINLSLNALFKEFENFNILINSDYLVQLPLYDLTETIVRSFNLVKTSNAYIQFYLDVVLDFSQKKASDISAFLEYFNKKKDSLSIVSPKGQNAVQIMTIHKSKGLEFPVVIFPYADLDIYRELEPKEWFKLNKEKYQDFTYALLNYNKDFENYGEEGKRIYNNHQAEQELDNINLLYVTLTRAVEQLYIISSKDISEKGEINNKKYSGLFIKYLQHLGFWSDSKSTYHFGNNKKSIESSTSSEEAYIQNEFISTSKEEHNIKVVTKSGFLWDTNQQDAIEKGNLVHDIMSQIKTKNDIDLVISDFINSSIINEEQALKLNALVYQIVEHPKLIDYYNSNDIVYNERDIITKENIVLRPDRIVINSKNEAVIIDYKTGVEDKKHEQQLQSYQDVLEEMKITVKKKILVYINKDIKVKDV